MAKKPKKTKSASTEVIIPQMKTEIKFKERKFKFTEKQQQLLRILLADETKIVFIAGPAGTSKTFMAVYAALNLVNHNEKDIIYIRTIAESGEKSLGSLPGTVGEKFQPYLLPLGLSILLYFRSYYLLWLKIFGAGNRVRTDDLLLGKQMYYQLYYTRILSWYLVGELNSRIHRVRMAFYH